jgi:hypothetical protein
MRVVDLGGEVEAWSNAHVRPAQLVIVNLFSAAPEVLRRHPWISSVVGDACDPTVLRGERFDLVYSNSVIEHLGGHSRRVAFSDTVDRLGPRHWVQTPNRYFPIEPHYWAPGAQFLPVSLRARAMRRWPTGRMRVVANDGDWPETAAGARRFPLAAANASIDMVERHHAVRGALTIELLSATELQFYFPVSTIMRDRLAGFTKSIIAVRDRER